MDELPDERTAELLLERTGALLVRFIVGAVERVTVERVVVGVVDTLLTVLEERTGVDTRVEVFCERVTVCAAEALRVVVRTLVLAVRVAVPRPREELRSGVRTFVLPNVRVAVLREDTRVVPLVTLREGVAVRTAAARVRSMSRALL